MAGPDELGATNLNWPAPGPADPVQPETAVGLVDRLMFVNVPNPPEVSKTRHSGFWSDCGFVVLSPSCERNDSVNGVATPAVVDVGDIDSVWSLMSANAATAERPTIAPMRPTTMPPLKNLLRLMTPSFCGPPGSALVSHAALLRPIRRIPLRRRQWTPPTAKVPPLDLQGHRGPFAASTPSSTERRYVPFT